MFFLNTSDALDAYLDGLVINLSSLLTSKSAMNTFAYIGSIRDKPIVKCVYQTDVNENKFIIKGDGQAEDGGVGINKEAIQF